MSRICYPHTAFFHTLFLYFNAVSLFLQYFIITFNFECISVPNHFYATLWNRETVTVLRDKYFSILIPRLPSQDWSRLRIVKFIHDDYYFKRSHIKSHIVDINGTLVTTTVIHLQTQWNHWGTVLHYYNDQLWYVVLCVSLFVCVYTMYISVKFCMFTNKASIIKAILWEIIHKMDNSLLKDKWKLLGLGKKKRYRTLEPR